MRTLSRTRRIQAASALLGGGVLATLAVLAVVAGDGFTEAQAQAGTNAMAVDAVSGGGVDGSVVVPAGGAFTVDLVITAAPTPYAGYGAKIEFNGGVINYDSFVYAPLGGTTLSAAATLVNDGCGPGCDRLQFGSARPSDTTSETGVAGTVTFHCVAEGSTMLHLLPPGEGVNHSTLLGLGGVIIPTSLTDAQVTCGEGGAPPPPAPTATSGPSTPAAGPQPTPTPLPPGMEAVPLAAGCNPVTSTYADASPIQTIADAVGPAGSLVSLWKFDAGTWRAYSPQYPQASDLAATEFLDVLFTCVGGPGDFVRPIV